MRRNRLTTALLVAALAGFGLAPAAVAETTPPSVADAALLARIDASSADQVSLLVDARGWAWFKSNSRAEIRRVGNLELWRVSTRDYTARRAVEALPDYAVFANTKQPLPEPLRAIGPSAVSGTNYRGITGADVVNGNGNKGAGQTVAVIDTGILASSDYFKDASLVSRIVAQGCWVYRDGSEDFPCLNGSNADTSAGAADVGSLSPAWQYEYAHGSHVAGIAAGRRHSSDPVGVTDGMAPEANIIALRVFGSGGAWDSDILSALSWVISHADTYSIASVNLSLGSYPSQSCDAYYLYGQYFGDLLTAGVAPVVAAGNDGVRNAIGAPACAPNAISIAATTPTDGIAWFSNLASSIDLGAPGTSILSLAPGSNSVNGSEGSFEAWNGTSMATPVAAGAFALAKASGYQLSPSTWLTHLRNTGTSISSDGVITKRINIDSAIEAAANALPPNPPTNVQVTQSDWNSFTLTWSAPVGGGTPTGYRISRNGSVLRNLSASTFSYSSSVLTADTVISVQTLTSGSISSAVNRTVTETSLTDPNWQLLASGSPLQLTDLVGADLCTLGGSPRVELSYYSPAATPRDVVVLDGTGRSLVVPEEADPTPATGFSGSGYARRLVFATTNDYLKSTANVFVFDELDRLSDGVALAGAAKLVSDAVAAGFVAPAVPTGLTASGNRLRADLSWASAAGLTWRLLVDGVAVADSAAATATVPVSAGAHQVAVCAVLQKDGREFTSAPSTAASVTVLPKLAHSIQLSLASGLVLGAGAVQATGVSDAQLPVTLASATPTICSVDGSGLVTPLLPGTCTINAESLGNLDYIAATATLSSTVTRPASLPVRSLAATLVSGRAKFTWLAPANAALTKVTGYRLQYRVSLPGKAFTGWRALTTTSRYWLSAKYIRGTRIDFSVQVLAQGGKSTVVRKLVKLP